MYVCLCNSVTDDQIHQAVDAGHTSFEDVQHQLSVSKGCGMCACDVKEIIEEKLQKELSSRPMLQVELGNSRTL